MLVESVAVFVWVAWRFLTSAGETGPVGLLRRELRSSSGRGHPHELGGGVRDACHKHLFAYHA